MICCPAAVSVLPLVRHSGAALGFCLLLSPAGAALTQTFSEPTTITVETRVQIFEERPALFPEGEELSTASLVLEESERDTTASPVLPPLRRVIETGKQGGGVTGTAADLNATASRLPARADRSSTAAQALQILRFERRNQIAEAFLLARDLVTRNPGDEFALDAAIRTSLVLGRAQDLEALYRQAIQRARLPGKYYVQLAHWYLRTGQTEKLKKLLADFEKGAPRDAEYHLTLTRMRIIAEDQAGARAVADQALSRKNTPVLFPMVMLAARLYRLLGDTSKAASTLLEAAGDDFGPWERRAQLIEFLKGAELDPEALVSMVEAALVNEPSYARARAIADRILDRALQERIFFPLRALLAEKVAADDATDIDRWLLALTYQREGKEDAALTVLQGGLPEDALTSGTSEAAETTHTLLHEENFLGGTTPVIAYERAMALARAGRHEEAAAIAANLLAEQPTEWPVRLLLAEQQLVAGDAAAALQTVSAWSGRQRLDPASRVRRAQVATSAAVALGDPVVLTETWVDLASGASFDELQAMGRVITEAEIKESTSSKAPRFRERVKSVIRERYGRNGEKSLWLLRARLAARDGDRGAEIGSYLRYLERDPENTAMLRYAADLAARYANIPLVLRSGRRQGVTLRATDSTAAEAALQLYRRLIELQPHVASNYSALMRIYLMRGEAETARRVAQELVERETSSPQSLQIAARILHENGFAADALPYYRPLVVAAPEDFELWARFAAALRAAGRPELAQPILRKILEEGLYGRPYAQEQLLASLVASARDSQGLNQLADYFDTVRTGDLPDKPGFLLTVARLLAEAGLTDRAGAFLADFEQLFPDSPLVPSALLLSARIRAASGEAEAAAQLRSVGERFPDSPQGITALLEAAELMRRSGQAAEAVELLEELAARRPKDDRALAALVHAARIAARELNDRPKAVLLLRRYLDAEAQDFELRREAQAELRRLGQELTTIAAAPAP